MRKQIPIAILFSTILASFAPLLISCGSSMNREVAVTSDDARDYKKARRELAEGVTDAAPTAEAEESDEASPSDPPDAKPVARLVIYQGRMQMQVTQPADTLKRVGDLAKEQGGFIERTNFEEGGRRVLVVLRIPVGRFFAMMDKLPELGTVLSRSIQANDVTKEFADVENRLQSARILKERLEKLLATVKNVEEKVKILREINRLATEIETLTARSKDLSDRASMSTIVLHLTAEPQATTSFNQRSPFPFVRDLNPSRRSIEDRSSVKAVRPEGFFDNEKEYRDGADHQFYSPDGTVLRSGEVQNRPTGDAAFWKKALSIEFGRRSYKELQSIPLSDGHLFLYRIHDGLNVYYYGVSYRITEKSVQIFEAFSPREEAYKKDAAKMIEFLKSIVEVKR